MTLKLAFANAASAATLSVFSLHDLSYRVYGWPASRVGLTPSANLLTQQGGFSVGEMWPVRQVKGQPQKRQLSISLEGSQL
jgi:hypothetical protein